MLRTKINQEFKKSGLTLYRLALLSGLQRTQIKRYLEGKTDLQGDNIDKLLKVLKIELKGYK